MHVWPEGLLTDVLMLDREPGRMAVASGTETQHGLEGRRVREAGAGFQSASMSRAVAAANAVSLEGEEVVDGDDIEEEVDGAQSGERNHERLQIPSCRRRQRTLSTITGVEKYNI